MTGSGDKNGIVWHHGSHQVGSLVEGIEINTVHSVRLHSTRQTIHLTTITVDTHKRGDAITDILVKGLPEEITGLVKITTGDSIGIRLVTLLQPALDLTDGTDLTGEVIQDLVGDILLAHITEIKRVTDMLPEVLDSLGDISEDITPLTLIAVVPLGHTLKLSLELNGSTLTAIMGNDLLGKVIVILQLRIDLTHILPRISVMLHDINDGLPVVGIDTAHGLTPEVGVLMERQLGIDLAEVKMNLSLIGETIALTVLGLHMTNLSGNTTVFFSRLQDTAVLTAVGDDRNTHRRQMVNKGTTGLAVLDGETTGSDRRLALVVLLLLTGLGDKDALFFIKGSLLLFISSNSLLLNISITNDTALTGIRGKNTLLMSTVIILAVVDGDNIE